MRERDRSSVDPPAADRGHADGEPMVQPLHDTHGVLVVDDDPMVRLVVQLSLEGDGFRVWSASNGWEALDLYQTHRDRIGVVLLDVRMPDPDGPATLDALRKLNHEVVACFMTGDMGAYEPEELRRRGAAHVIAKPFSLDELADVLRHLTHGVAADLLSAGETCQG